jgi:hypothetical protein
LKIEGVRRAIESGGAPDKLSGVEFMRSKQISIFLIVSGLIFIFALSTSAQAVKTESIVSSNIVKVWLPSGAEEVLPESVPAELTAMLEKLVADFGKGKWKPYESQVLIWKGAEFKKTGADTIVSRLTERIKTAEWQYKPGKTESGMTVFTVQEDATGNIVVGFYIAAEDGLMWAWTLVTVE